MTEWERRLEAILIAAGSIDTDTLADYLGTNDKGLQQLLRSYRETLEGRGFTLREVGQNVSLAAVPEFAQLLGEWLALRPRVPLSGALLESVAVIAYRQPISALQVERWRGVRAQKSLDALLELGLIEPLDETERPLRYRTTEAFLEAFGLKDLKALPPLPPDLLEDAEG